MLVTRRARSFLQAENQPRFFFFFFFFYFFFKKYFSGWQPQFWTWFLSFCKDGAELKAWLPHRQMPIAQAHPKGKPVISLSPLPDRQVPRGKWLRASYLSHPETLQEKSHFVFSTGTKYVQTGAGVWIFHNIWVIKGLIYLTLGKERKYSILIGLQIKSPEGVRKPSFWSYLPDVILSIIFYLLLMCCFTPLFYYFYDDTS